MAVTIRLNPGCENEKSYQVPFISGRALTEIDMVEPAFERSKQNENPTQEDMQNCMEWFCHLFRNQFTVDELLDGYPAGDLMPDIFAAYMTMISGAIKLLTEFPIPPAPTKTALQEKK